MESKSIDSISIVAHKKDNKQRVKEHRLRKKEFYQGLEKQVIQLKEEVARLQEENKSLK